LEEPLDTTAYEVTAYREGRWWMVAVLEFDALTQARRRRDVARMAREVVALATGRPVKAVRVRVRLAPTT
jgi:hypothetical protein